MKKKKLHIPNRAVRTYLRVSLSATLLASVALLISYLDARAIDRIGAAFDYAPASEYIMASLFIALGGAFVLELVATDPRFRKDS